MPLQGLAAFIAGLVGFWTILYLLGRGRSGRVEVKPGYAIIRAGIRLEPMEPGPAALFWRLFGLFSLAATAFMAGLFYYFTVNLFVLRYISPPPGGAPAGFVPLIPGVTLTWTDTVYVLVAVGIAALVHELSHAYVGRSVGIRVKDAGIALFLFIPAAFVEPDEESLKRAPRRARLLMYSAGVGANTVLALAILALLSAAASGVMIVAVEEGSPAAHAGLMPGDVIVAVNGTRVESVADLAGLLSKAGIGDPNTTATVELTVERNGERFNITVYKPEGTPYIGIRIVDYYGVPLWAAVLARSLYIINLSLAVINAAPLAIPLPGGMIYADGGHIVRELLEKPLGERQAAAAAATIGVATLILVLSLMSLGRLALSP